MAQHLMENIAAVLKGTQGVFSPTATRAAADSFPVPYVSIAHDKQNLHSDMLHLFSDIRKAVEVAQLKESK